MTSFERIGGREVWSGKIATVYVDRFRYADGKEADREIVRHPGAVVIVAHDGERVYLVRQPREAVGDELLELPAGKLDEEGEEPLDAAKRELAEEVGKGARNWKAITTFYSSPGLLDEKMHLFLATDLYDDQADTADDDERIEIEAVPLAEIDGAIERCRDAKSLVGLLWLKAYGSA